MSVTPVPHTLSPLFPHSGRLFVLVGPAGVGKNTLMKAVIDQGRARQLPTATSRAIRPGETEGVQHYFVTLDRFQAMIVGDELLEYQQVHGTNRYYGIVRQPLEDALTAGESLIADIEILGAQIVRAALPANVVSIFITLDRLCHLKSRMEERSEPTAEIARRMLRAPQELAYMPHCDYAITNDDAATAAERLIALIDDVNGGRIPSADRPAPFNLRYEAELLLMHAGSRLVRQHDNATLCLPFDPPAYPHLSLIAAAGQQLGIAIEAAMLHGCAPLAEDGFLPPANLTCSYAEGVDTVRYTYTCDLPDALPAPAGWVWQHDTVSQPVPA